MSFNHFEVLSTFVIMHMKTMDGITVLHDKHDQ